LKRYNFAKVSREKPAWMVFVKQLYKMILVVILVTCLIIGIGYLLVTKLDFPFVTYYWSFIVTVIINVLIMYKSVLKILRIWDNNYPDM